MDAEKSPFEVLSAINCNGHTEKKNGLTYLSWAWAWQMVKNNFPLATYTVYEDREGRFYHTDGKTAWVKTGVTIDGIEHIEYLPVMDFRNASIPLDKLTSFDVNKAIQRSLTKACARHGIGLYIYAGEDLPECEAEDGVKPESLQTNGNGPSRAPNEGGAAVASEKPEARQGASSASYGSDELKRRCKEVMLEFCKLESVKSMDKDAKMRFFKAKLKAEVGKDDPTKLTMPEWNKVSQAIDIMRAEG